MNTHGIRYRDTGEWLKDLNETPMSYPSRDAAREYIDNSIPNAGNYFRVEPLPEE